MATLALFFSTAGATFFFVAASAVGTADALCSAFFLFDYINKGCCHCYNKYSYDYKIGKSHYLFTSAGFFSLFNAYSSLNFLLLLIIMPVITPAIASITIRPGIKPAPNAPVVTSEPI